MAGRRLSGKFAGGVTRPPVHSHCLSLSKTCAYIHTLHETDRRDSAHSKVGEGLERISRTANRKKLPFESLKLKENLGGGSFGNVFSGTYCGPEGSVVHVAVKDIFKLDVFEHEAMVLALLDHENIVKYIGDCQHDFRNYIVTELVLDGDLRRFLDEAHAPLPDLKSHSIIFQLAAALKYLHNFTIPIIHRWYSCSQGRVQIYVII